MGGRSGGRKASDQVLMTARQLFARYKPGRDDARAPAAAAAGRRPHGDQAHRDLQRAGAAQHAGRLPHEPGRRLRLDPRRRLAHLPLPRRPAGQAHQGPLLRAGAGGPRRDHRGGSQRPPAGQHPAGLPGHEVDAAAGRHPLHPAAAARRRADGLQRRRCGTTSRPRRWARCWPTQSPREAAELLVAEARARARGTGDNISLVVAEARAAAEG